jgi:hypothetical protein
MNRRRFLGLGLGVAGTAGVAAGAGLGETTAGADEGPRAEVLGHRNRPVEHAYDYLSLAMDAYQQGQIPRLVQSFSDSQQLGSTAFVYDNSLATLAYLERGRPDDVARAMLLGDSFLYAQTHDPIYADGRVRQAYWVGPFTLPFASTDAYFVRADGSVNLVGAPWFFVGSSVSDMAWVGIAFAQLFARTGRPRYLDGSLRLARWIVDHAFDTIGLGGYSFGVDGNNRRLSSIKLTEQPARPRVHRALVERRRRLLLHRLERREDDRHHPRAGGGAVRGLPRPAGPPVCGPSTGPRPIWSRRTRPSHFTPASRAICG